MKNTLTKLAVAVAINCTFFAISPAIAEDGVYSMRSIKLGITLEQFRAEPIINDTGMTDLQTWCDNDKLPRGVFIDPRAADKDHGVISCQWFSRYENMAYMSPSEHWVDLGSGKGPPVFEFIKDGATYRLFEISFRANTEYYQGVLEALNGKYGVPKTTKQPFQTRAGAVFESSKSAWSNASSAITLTFRCGHTERYCLRYNHVRLSKIYLDAVAAKNKEAAGKI